MEAKTVAVFGVILLLIAGAVVVLGTIPTSAYSGNPPTIVCTADLTVSGTYTDLIVSHSISNFALTGGGTGCHPQTLLDLVGATALTFCSQKLYHMISHALSSLRIPGLFVDFSGHCVPIGANFRVGLHGTILFGRRRLNPEPAALSISDENPVENLS